MISRSSSNLPCGLNERNPSAAEESLLILSKRDDHILDFQGPAIQVVEFGKTYPVLTPSSSAITTLLSHGTVGPILATKE